MDVEAFRIGPESFWKRWTLAHWMAELGANEDAASQCKQALKLWVRFGWGPGNREAQMIRILMDNGFHTETLHYAETALKLPERFGGDFLALKLEALLGLGRVDDAFAFYDEQLGQREIWCVAPELARALRKTNRVDEAHEFLDGWLNNPLRPGCTSGHPEAEGWREMAEIRQALGDSEGADAARSHAVECDGEEARRRAR